MIWISGLKRIERIIKVRYINTALVKEAHDGCAFKNIGTYGFPVARISVYRRSAENRTLDKGLNQSPSKIRFCDKKLGLARGFGRVERVFVAQRGANWLKT